MSILASIRSQLVPIHREGLQFIGLFALASLVLFWLWTPLGRIGCFVREGAVVGAGERIGMIRFGSRVDVYLPDGVRPQVAEGQTATAGETVIADLRAGVKELTFRVG